MSEIQAIESREPVALEVKSAPRQIRQVFHVIHGDRNKEPEPKSPTKDTKWTTEEHLKFIEGMQKYGKQWTLLHESISTKSPAQIRTHAQNFLIKAERAAGSIDVIEYIRSKPATFFLSSTFDKTSEKDAKFSRKRDFTYSTPYSNDLDFSLIAKKKKSGSEVPHNYSLDHLISRPEPIVPPSNNPSKEEAKLNLANGNKKINHVANHIKKIRKKKKTKEKSPKQPPVEPPAPQEQNFPNEEEKVMQGPYASYPPGPPVIQSGPMPYQYPSLPGKLMDIIRELGTISDGLAAEKPNCRPLIESDPQFKYYWEALENCSVSLQHIIGDIYYIHINSQPMQAQFMYQPPPMYYPQEPPRGGYMAQPPYYQEKPPGSEY